MTIKSINLLLLPLLFLVGCASQNDNDPSPKITELEKQLTLAQTEIAALKADAAAAPGLIHSVFFWLKDDLTTEQEAEFRAGVESLRRVSSVQQMYVGPVAPTEARGVVDNSYNIALLVHFTNLAGQDAYQIDPIHLKFVEDHQDKWTKVVVYDSLVE